MKIAHDNIPDKKLEVKLQKFILQSNSNLLLLMVCSTGKALVFCVSYLYTFIYKHYVYVYVYNFPLIHDANTDVCKTFQQNTKLFLKNIQE